MEGMRPRNRTEQPSGPTGRKGWRQVSNCPWSESWHDGEGVSVEEKQWKRGRRIMGPMAPGGWVFSLPLVSVSPEPQAQDRTRCPLTQLCSFSFHWVWGPEAMASFVWGAVGFDLQVQVQARLFLVLSGDSLPLGWGMLRKDQNWVWGCHGQLRL